MIWHRYKCDGEGMAIVDRCGESRDATFALSLTAPNGPNGGTQGDDHYARYCPICGTRLVLRWNVTVDQLVARAGGV